MRDPISGHKHPDDGEIEALACKELPLSYEENIKLQLILNCLQCRRIYWAVRPARLAQLKKGITKLE